MGRREDGMGRVEDTRSRYDDYEYAFMRKRKKMAGEHSFRFSNEGRIG